MPKNIVILFDGTSNRISDKRTNVLRLYGTLKKSPHQLVYYDPGVGSMGAANALTGVWQWITEILGQATGWGIEQNVKDAYAFLVENYENGKLRGEKDIGRDRIYIFGFSRGAYTARMLAGFIKAVGLVEARNLNLVDYAFDAYKHMSDRHKSDRGDSTKEVDLYKRILSPDNPPIRLLGLFDTVGTVVEIGLRRIGFATYGHTDENDCVEAVRHAVAIEEKRSVFRPHLWIKGQTFRSGKGNKPGHKAQDLKEVWFSGYHCDVGGGYAESESALAKIALEWMINATTDSDILYDESVVDLLVRAKGDPKLAAKYVKPDPLAKAYDSMKWYWGLLEFFPRRTFMLSKRPSYWGFTIPFFAPRAIPEGAVMHQSVKARIDAGLQATSNFPEKYEFAE